MPEYLSKEEVKQWRSSLEKITLEEYAARLGKVIAEEKQTNDLVDIVLKGQPVMSKAEELTQSRVEKISSISQRSFDREKEISQSPFSVSVTNNKKSQPEKAQKAEVKKETKVEAEKKVAEKTSQKSEISNQKTDIIFSKSLTDREQMVFDYFAKNKKQIVYAKDLATLLDLPRDYVYKYIKNLRAKIGGDLLQNADIGGYVLNV